MPLIQPSYRIAVDSIENEHVVSIRPADQLRAETEGNRRGLTEPKRQGTLLTMLWLWAAARREGLVEPDCKFEPFVERLATWAPVKADDGEESVVDPTRPEESLTYASDSEPTSPVSTGSPPQNVTPLY